ncbi:MAG: biotin/lipoyl-binding protein [Hydrococcus sp. C42_A2020_068]|nr:biotin/lipoyl-binding protein [Pleurocapsa sp. PCC 7327]MBF2021316.1 biotin/lipoyl-binding protein [Hydrococcus sp. C42_A2020_068]
MPSILQRSDRNVKEGDRVSKGQIIARMNSNWGRRRDRNSYTHNFLR